MLANGNGAALWNQASPGCADSVMVKVQDIKTLRTHWPWVEKRLLRLHEKDRSIEKWQPGHVREAIIRGFNGQSTVELYFSIAKDNSIEGFMITTVYADPYTQLPESLVCWVLWANKELIDHYLPTLNQMAKERFLSRIDFISGRRGWLAPKKTARRGFRCRAMIFSRDVT